MPWKIEFLFSRNVGVIKFERYYFRAHEFMLQYMSFTTQQAV